MEKVVSDLTAVKLNTNNEMTLLLEKPNNVFQSETVEVYILMKYYVFTTYIFLKNWEYRYEGLYIRIWTSLLQNDTVWYEILKCCSQLDGAHITDDERKNEICVETIVYTTSI